MKKLFILPLALLAGLTGSCLSARSNPRSYYVLGPEPVVAFERPLLTGVVRVRDMDADAIYEKFQIVVRRSPYELRYNDLNVWAVKPNSMVSDVIALGLEESGTFNSVTRVLGDTRPKYTIAGELHAIEVYDSEDVWFAHLAMSLSLLRFSDGERLWTYHFDERKTVGTTTFSHAVRALSELLAKAIKQTVRELSELRQTDGPAMRRRAPPPPPIAPPPPKTPPPIFVPEPEGSGLTATSSKSK